MSRLKKYDKLWIYFAPFFLGFLAVDQLTKWWAVENLRLGETVDFGFSLSHNYGIVFGVQLAEPLIFLLTGLILAVGLYLVVKEKMWQDHRHLAALSLLSAGAIGNLADRIRLGYVVDFIQVYWWPTFNLADAYIVVSVLLFAWIFIRQDS